MNYHIAFNKDNTQIELLTEPTPDSYGPLDLVNLRRHLSRRAEELMYVKIMTAYQDLCLKPNETPDWAKDCGYSLDTLRMYQMLALKVIAEKLCGDRFSYELYNPVHDEINIIIKEKAQ